MNLASSHRLASWLLVSTLAHAAVFSGWAYVFPATKTPAQGAPIIHTRMSVLSGVSMTGADEVTKPREPDSAKARPSRPEIPTRHSVQTVRRPPALRKLRPQQQPRRQPALPISVSPKTRLATVVTGTGPVAAEPVNIAMVNHGAVTTIETLDSQRQGEEENNDSAARLLEVLHREIDRHKRYPYIAKRRRLDGVATIAFQLGPDGEIGNIKVLKSSGHGALDRAAGAAVARVSPVEEASSYVQAAHDFQVKVVFARSW